MFVYSSTSRVLNKSSAFISHLNIYSLKSRVLNKSSAFISHLNNPSFNNRNNIWRVKLDDVNSIILTSAHNVIDNKRNLVRDDIIGSLVELNWSIPNKYILTGDRRFDLAYLIYHDEINLEVNQTIFYPSFLHDRFVDVQILTMNNTNIDGIDDYYTTSPLLFSTSLSLSNEVLNTGERKFIYEAYNVGHRGISGAAVLQNNNFCGIISCLGTNYDSLNNSKTRSIIYSWNWIKQLLNYDSIKLSKLKDQKYGAYISKSKLSKKQIEKIIISDI